MNAYFAASGRPFSGLASHSAVLRASIIALFIAGRAATVTEGIAQAAAAIDRGAASDTLAKLIAISTADLPQTGRGA